MPLALVGILVCISVAAMIRTNSILEYIGKNSIVILGLQEPVYRAVIFVLSKVCGIKIEMIRTDILLCLLVTALSVFAIIPAITLFNKGLRPRINLLFA